MKHSFNPIAVAILALGLAAPSAWAHGGEDHAAEAHGAAVVAPVAAAVRGEAASEAFEIVAAIEGERLMLYLDRFDSGEPVSGATLEVEMPDFKATAAGVAPGVYAMAGSHFAQPGTYPMTVTVEAGDTVDLLSVSLTRGERAVASAPAAPASWLNWGIAGGVLVFGIGLTLARRVRQTRRQGGERG